MLRYICVCLLGLLLLACSTSKGIKNINIPNDNIDELYALMTGTFSSEEQSIADTSYFNINLVMYPIWNESSNSKWLYVEQAATANLTRPYRQRVYQLYENTKGIYESKVYELPDPSRFVEGWKQPDIFKAISPDSLIERQGCTVYLEKIDHNCYRGSTKDKECKSTLRGAAYATSTVHICNGEVLSWDQGWNEEDVQVWGATKAGYIFKQKK